MSGHQTPEVQTRQAVGASKLPKVLFGCGALDTLAGLLTDLGVPGHSPTAVLVVHGRSLIHGDVHTRLMENLQKFNASFVQQPSTPSAQSVRGLVDEILAHDADIVVAVGGGGVMDGAKAAVAHLRTDKAAKVRAITVPTTPGSGAEVTPFATLWDVENGRKQSVNASGCVIAAIVDPDLVSGLPLQVLAASVLDTLTQGAEAVWSTRSTPESIAAGLAAVALVSGAHERLLTEEDDDTRKAASLAGHLSGQAIAISQTTACHALSYPLTARYRLSHGHACGLALCALLSYNSQTMGADCQDPRGVDHVRDVTRRVMYAMGAATPAAARSLVCVIRSAGKLGPYAACGADDTIVAQDALTYGRLENNPRRLDAASLGMLLRSMREEGQACM